MDATQQDFSAENTHEHNVQVSIEKILGGKTSLRSTKRNAEDHRKATFIRIIDNLMITEDRKYMFDEMYDMNFDRYDQIYMDIIEDALSLSFNKRQMTIIRFFLIDRFTDEGVLELIDENGTELVLHTPEDLWEVLKMYK